jgi:hypothetical protein
MSTKIKGLIDAEIFTTDDGFVAIQQGSDTPAASAVLLSADQLPAVIDALRTCYERRAEWQEPIKE